MMTERKCKICGKLFMPRSSRRSVCYEEHYHPCPICGEPVLTKDLQHLEECCCPEHSRLKRIQTTRDRHGEEWPSNSAEARAKRKATNLKRYGVDNPSKDPEIRKRVSEGLHKRYAIDGEDIKKRAAQTLYERTGYYYSMQNPETVAAIKQRNLEKYGYENTFQVPEFQKKADATNLEKYGSTIPMQNPKVWQKHRNQKSKYRGCDGTVLDSTYEVSVYNYCKRNNIPIKRTVPLPYEYLGQKHKTFIDFEIDGLLVEVKGEHAMGGYCDNQPGAVPMWRKLEIYKEHHVVVVTGSEASHYFTDNVGLKYLNQQSDPLIGVDISLFKEPEFPYPDNRPKCFFDVSVSGQLTPVQAFNDEKIRWDMIKNRIDYVGGFITSKDILRALNVTRKAKQPSWFSKELAKRLIYKYCDSLTIVDPFAGWGTRHDAAKEMHRIYIGCDLNSELVKWHHDQGRSIQLGDANTFCYNGDCDVLICPPYRDTEIYFEGQDCTTTECQWMDIVRRNVPNARKYIMVCKEVSPEYAPYVVDTKVNKSHLGKNEEYIVVVSNKEIN